MAQPGKLIYSQYDLIIQELIILFGTDNLGLQMYLRNMALFE